MIKRNLSTIGLFLATLGWGLSFFLVKKATLVIGVWPFLFWRFAFAVGFMVLIFPKKFFLAKIRLIRRGLLLGILLFLAVWTQTEGLQLTTIGRSGFITSLYVPFTPLFTWLFLKRPITIKHFFVVTLATLGLYALTLQANTLVDFISWWRQMNPGDVWTLGTAIVSSIHIVLCERISREEPDSIALGLWQFFWCFILVAFSLLIRGTQNHLLMEVGFWQFWTWSPFVIVAV